MPSAVRVRAHLPVVEAEEWALHLLVRAAAQQQGGVHVIPMRAHVEHDERCEADDPIGVQPAQDNAQARRRRAVGDHVEHGTKRRRLLQKSRCEAISCIQQLADQVDSHGHAVVDERIVIPKEGEHHARVANQIGHVKVDGSHGNDDRDHRPHTHTRQHELWLGFFTSVLLGLRGLETLLHIAFLRTRQRSEFAALQQRALRDFFTRLGQCE